MKATVTNLLLILPGFALGACVAPGPTENRWAFACPDGYAFEIAYSADVAVATLKDSEGETALPISRSASGARYANSSTVFWNKGTMAFIEQDGVIVHQDCQGEKITK